MPSLHPSDGGRVLDGPSPPRPEVQPVEVLRWPAQADARAPLVGTRVPRLLVLEPGARPPVVWDDLEDWVTTESSPIEIAARAARLEGRARGVPAAPLLPLPLLDGDGTLRAGDGREVRLGAIDARLVHLLLEHCDRVVRRDELTRAGWPGGRVSDRAVDARICRLRRQVAPVGLRISTVRGHGYLLESPRRA